jgi:hypothetical protein
MTVDLILPLSGAPPTLRPEPSPVPPSTNAAATTATEAAPPSATQTPPSLQAIVAADFSITAPGSAAIDGRTISLATEAAAISQRDLAALMADLVQTLQNAEVPTAVRTAIDQVLASRLPLDAQPTVADIKAALTQSGLLTSAQSGSTPLPSATTPAAASSLSAGGSLKGALIDLQQALGTWLESAAPSPTPLSASAAASAASPAAPLENAVTPQVTNAAPVPRLAGAPASLVPNTTQPLVGSPPPAGVSPSAATTDATAVPSPSSFNTAPAVVASPTGTSAVPVAAPPAVATIQQNSAPVQQTANPSSVGIQAVAAELPAAIALAATPVAEASTIPAATAQAGAASRVPAQPTKPSIDAMSASNPVADTVAADIAVLAQKMSSAASAIVDLKQAVTVFEQLFKAWFDNSQGESSPAESPSSVVDGITRLDSPSAMPRVASPATSPSPSDRGGPASAPPSMPAVMSPSGEPVAAINRLMRETNAALTHQNLLGIASLPAEPPGAARTDGQVSQWMFEIPFATPQGCAVAQFKISREGTKGKKSKQAPVWRAHFSLDVEPMGPVHAQIALSGERTWISLWAEREESATRLRDHEALLTKSLIDSELIAEIAIHAGVPRQTAPVAGRFLDHQS